MATKTLRAKKPSGGPARPYERPPIGQASTPLMKQYLKLKAAHESDVLFFRMGDFYEMFYEDAALVSRVLGIALTSRGSGRDEYAMAGFPIHALDRYLPRMISDGYRVAICEQVEDAAVARENKRIVRREVIEVHTPGTLTDEKLLDAGKTNFLLALHLPRRNSKLIGLAWFEASSGRFLVANVGLDQLESELERIAPAEILVTESLARDGEREPSEDGKNAAAHLLAQLKRRAPVAEVPDWVQRPKGALEALLERFGVATLAGLGLDDRATYVPAANTALHYVSEKKPGFLENLGRFGRGIELYRPERHLVLDAATSRCLEITRPLREGSGDAGTLLGAIDRTRTAMGRRLLREWLLSPLRDPSEIAFRQDAVAALLKNPGDQEALEAGLRRVYDLERLAGRVASGRAKPRDLAALRDSLASLPQVQGAARSAAGVTSTCEGESLLNDVAARLDPLGPLHGRLDKALAERPANAPKDGPIFADGWSKELDRLRAVTHDVNETLAQFQEREIKRSGIPSLKVGYNKVFGYYLEITRAHRDKIPEGYIRKQTLKNAERFLTPELKELESEILTARERMESLEARLFEELREEVAATGADILASAAAAAELDVLSSLATLARGRAYVRPTVSDGLALKIVQGRHPVLDLQDGSERFVPNDVVLGADAGVLHLITGPNMAGKSTYIRQAALLTLLAQTGSFVPAAEAEIGVVDRIFARVGAGDELAQGLSTFMVEMTETANILRHATDRSLVILDEVGRGTSTYDGVSLAWAIAEYLHDRICARTLFATHYHELTGLSETKAGVRNRNVAVEDRGDDVVFLHQIVPGTADRSYGIHVGRLAGLPKSVLKRATIILSGLEAGTFDPATAPPEPREESQLGLFASSLREDALRNRLRSVEIDETTPMQALLLLQELSKLL
jgi:DNA mismatch repair protein MutS